MVERSPIQRKTIVIADRGYESYNNFAHIKRKGWNYLIRVKDLKSNGILSGLRLPADGEFDQDVHLTLTKKQTREIKAHPEIYKCIPSTSTFDFLDLNENLFYPISFRGFVLSCQVALMKPSLRIFLSLIFHRMKSSLCIT